jgi:hypothetical protein
MKLLQAMRIGDAIAYSPTAERGRRPIPIRYIALVAFLGRSDQSITFFLTFVAHLVRYFHPESRRS